MLRYETSPGEFRRERAFMKRVLTIAIPVALVLTLFVVALLTVPFIAGEDRGLSFLAKVVGVAVAATVFWFFGGLTAIALHHQKPMFVDDNEFLLDSVSIRPRRQRYGDVESARHSRRADGDWAILLRMKDGSEIGVVPDSDTPNDVYDFLLKQLRDRGVPVSTDDTL